MMQAILAKRVLIIIVAVFSVSLLVGCSGMEKRPQNREGYLYYPAALVNADRALDEARAAGKDKECPAEFNALRDQVDKAYELYMACDTQGAIDMANDAIAKIKALCPPKRVVEVKPEPRPEPKPTPPPPPPPPPVVEPAKITLEDIHFDFDKATLTDEAKEILDRDIKTLKENPGIKVQIEGHACQHGSERYNMGLTERRANAVKEYLVKAGIEEERLTTIAYGKSRPLCVEEPNPKNKNSECMKSNRRVHFEEIAK
jgi:OOP family OmpA-OmpF porin